MENENDKNYLDERKGLDENDSPNLDPENEIESGPKKELLGSSDGAGELKNESNEIVTMMKKRKRKDLTIPIILGIVFLMIITIAGFYLLRDKDIPLVGAKNPQQKILNSSMIAMNDIESYSFEGDLNFNFTKDDEEGFSLAMKFDGQADGSDTDNIKSSFNVSPEISVSTEGGSEDVSFDFSMRSFGKVGEEMAYFKLNDFDLGAAGMIYGGMIVPYKNKWYSLDMEELQEMGGASMEMEKDFNPEEMIDRIKELFKKYEMIKFQKDLGDTKLGDVDVYHYQVTIDSEVALDFYVEFFKLDLFSSKFIYRTKNNKEVDIFIEENKKEILAVFEEFLANIKTEIWIGKKDGMIYKIAIKGEFDQESIEGLARKIEKIEGRESDLIYDNSFGELSFDTTITMSNFNQPVNISKPEKSEDLMKVLEEIMMGFMGGMMPGYHFPVENNNDFDHDGLTNEREEFYGTDPNNPDTDGDGFSDGNEVARGYDPLLPGEAKLDYDKMFKY